MFDYKQKIKIKSFLYSPLAVFLLVLIALYSLYSTWSIYTKFAKSRQDLDTVQKQMLTLDSQNTSMDEQIASLQTQQGVEDEIRTKFGEAKAGESMAVIVDTDDGTSSAATTTPMLLWTKVEHFFGL